MFDSLIDNKSPYSPRVNYQLIIKHFQPQSTSSTRQKRVSQAPSPVHTILNVFSLCSNSKEKLVQQLFAVSEFLLHESPSFVKLYSYFFEKSHFFEKKRKRKDIIFPLIDLDNLCSNHKLSSHNGDFGHTHTHCLFATTEKSSKVTPSLIPLSTLLVCFSETLLFPLIRTAHCPWRI